jgi:hypothetical protein
MRPLVYIESSIVSYLAARPSRDLIVAAHQQITWEWWDNVRPQVDCYLSPFVIQEISAGDKEAANRRLELVKNMPLLEANKEIQDMAERYYEAIDIPEKARLDSFHLAAAVWHEMDYLLSWNCKHIVSGRTIRIIERINSSLSIRTPVFCTPEELMEV